MKYIILDGYLEGTGIKDISTSEYVNFESLNLTPLLLEKIKEWHKKYFNAKIANQNHLEGNVFNRLDIEGIELSKLVLNENPDFKIDYYYSDFLGRRIYPQEWEAFLANAITY